MSRNLRPILFKSDFIFIRKENKQMNTATQLDPVSKLTKDLREASRILSRDEARYLVDSYYQMQNDRIRAAAQVRQMSKTNEPCEVLGWLFQQTETLEKQIAKALTGYAETDFVGSWAMSVCGIGGVLSAGLLAHIDIEKAPTVGHIWNFAGLNPEMKWGKGEKRPWNAKLKVVCWKIGQSFIKVSGREADFYGKRLLERRDFETVKNEQGDYAAQAARQLTEKKYNRTEDVYKYLSGQFDPEVNRKLKEIELKPMTHDQLQNYLSDEKNLDKLLERADGEQAFDFLDRKVREFNGVAMLSPGQILLRACRHSVKLFLSHWHEVAYRARFNKMPPKPFAIEHLGHAHYIPVPNNPF